ncbi:DUF4873 domain-containing protein [Nocardiopsis sp. NPDC050513]|uniref:DUF4873 domain-containing protein n=1 Tax=Nocardiopsis sp. NPDC050513 TaxID=3364338 RepID=UPI003795E0CC
MSGSDGEEGYRGAVTVVLPDGEVEADAHLAGRFSPLTGDYRWKGRLAAHPSLSAAFARGVRTVRIRTPGGHEGTGDLDGPDLWGGHPVSGAGAPPFAVPRVTLDD